MSNKDGNGRSTSYMVNGRPVSKEVYDKHSAEMEAKSAAFTANFNKVRDEQMDTASSDLKAELEPESPAPVMDLNPGESPPVTTKTNDGMVNTETSESGVKKSEAPLKVDNPNNPGQVWRNRINLSMGKGLPNEQITNALSGFNHRIVTQSLPQHRELQGYAFITRPDMNLTEENIANSRFFSWLASKPTGSIEHSVLAALDPQCPLTNPHGRYGMPCDKRIPFDNLQAFIPIMSSQLRSLSGFPDQTLDVWMSEEGAYREQYGMVDSVYEVNNAFTLNATFNNCVGDPIMLLVRGILEWSSGVRRGLYKPKTYNQVARRIDYQSRIYVFKFDATGRRVVNWGAAMVAWPMNDNEGSLLNFQADRSIVDDTREVNIQFQCIGARYRDTLLFETFNETVAMFNPEMIPDYGAPLFGTNEDGDIQYNSYSPIGGDGLVEISDELLPLFNYYGYPIIDPDTNAFRWFVPLDVYKRILGEGGIRVE